MKKIINIGTIKDFIRYHKRAYKFIVVLIILLFAYDIYALIARITDKKPELLGYTVQSQEEFMKSRAGIASDIDGLSQYDKFLMGLDYHDGSDTDGDGLTDKEEIEIYGTDPLKASTSGDLYTDSYKVANDMDTSKQYENANIVFSCNECSEISFLNVNIDNMGAMAEVNTYHAHTLSDYGVNKVYAEYFIHEYAGKISIDVSKVLNDNNLKLSDICIYVIKGTFSVEGKSELKECKYTADGTTLNLTYDFTRGTSYYLYVTEKKSFINKIFAASSSKLKNSQDTEVSFFAETSPILQLFKITKLKIYYPDQGSVAANEIMKDMAYNYYTSFTSMTPKEDIDFIAASAAEISKKYKSRQSILSVFEAKNGEDYILSKSNFKYMIYFYCINTTEKVYAADSSSGSNGTADTIYKYNNYHTTFDPYVDELPFQNFKSKYGTSGNCSAITYLTSNLFNKGSFPASGSYAGIEWDLSIDSDNNTLTDKGLYDYKTRTFVDDKTTGNDFLPEENLTAGENEFVKMIGAYYLESQDKLPYLNEYMIDNSTQTLSWSVAENMMERLNQGKIINIGLYLNNGTGHEITAYDYYFTSENELTFRIYDSNLPQNIKAGVKVNNGGACYLKCQKIKNVDGTYSMKYIYYPVKESFGYMATSDSSLMSTSAFIVSDENWDVLN